MIRVIEGFIKFYIVYFFFGTLALIILFASADLKFFIETGEGFFQALVNSSDSISEEASVEIVEKFFLIVFESVPGDTFFDAVLGISFDSNVGADITSLVIDLLKSGETISVLARNLQNYTLFWRDMAVATSASVVLYAVAHLKSKIAGQGISVWLGFALASVFWIFAGYTFAETLIYALDMRVRSDNLNVLYIIITATAILLEGFIHAYGGKCSAIRLLASLCLKIFFNLLRSAFVFYLCRIYLSFFNIEVLSVLDIYLNTFGMTVSTGIVIGTVLIEAKVNKWAEKMLNS